MRPKVIGLTGGIGSGKTTIAKYFEAKGVPLYIADEESKKILDSPDAMAEIEEAFGQEVFSDSKIDRKKLANLVFNDAEKLFILNGVLHPKVQHHFEDWAKKQSTNFVIKEAAILFESGSYKDCDRVILITAPLDIRIRRVMNRDDVTREQVLERIANQWTDDKKIPLSDFIIENTELENAKIAADKVLALLNEEYN
ncbi:MAG: dephospho-CoA kinase [Sphingobacteriales bacterium]|nr:MAG: dephospho-CoA kinase [Sphingobacteriales bacterium]